MTNPIRTLQELARDHVGDGKTPNLFFVTDNGETITVSRDFETAYRHWQELAKRSPRVECALEDRKTGCIASVEPMDDGDTRLVLIDDSEQFGYGVR